MTEQEKKLCPQEQYRQDILFEQVMLLAGWNKENMDDIQEVRSNIDAIINLLDTLDAPASKIPSIEEFKNVFKEMFEYAWRVNWNRLRVHYPHVPREMAENPPQN